MSAAGRFRGLAEAYRVLATQAAAPPMTAPSHAVRPRGAGPAASVPVRRARPGGVTGLSPVPGPPLRAARSGWTARSRHRRRTAGTRRTSGWPCWPELALRYLARDRGRPW